MRPKFHPGKVSGTPLAIKAVRDAGQEPAFFLDKHVTGDWGTVSEDDKRANEDALMSGDRIVSAYRTLKGEKIWIVTEAKNADGVRPTTTVMVPEDY